MFNFNYRQIENDIKLKGIEEVKLFYSMSYRNYLQKIARNNSGNYDVSVFFDQNSDTAYTDGDNIYLNPFLKMFEQFSLSEKTLINLGFLAHELFHVLYTEFNLLKELLGETKKYKYMNILKDIQNIIEDSAIELYGTNYYVGDFKTAIIFLNESIYKISPNIEDIDNNLSQIMSAMCLIGASGKIKGNIKKLSKEVKQILKKITPLINKGRLSESTSGRIEAAKEIYEVLLPVIEANAEKYKQPQMKTNNFRSRGSGACSNLNKPSKEDIKQDFQEEVSSNKSDKNKKNKKGLKNEQFLQDGEQNNSSDNKSNNNSGKKQNKNTSEENVNDKLKALDNDLNKVKDEIVKDEAENKVKDLKNGEINNFMKNIDYGIIHRNIKTINRFLNPNEENVEIYNSYYEQQKLIINNVTNQLKKMLKYQQDDIKTGQRCGTVAVSQISRIYGDGKIFQRNKEKNKVDLAFTILVDLSGSMKNYNRLYYSKQACLLMIEVCKKLNIPIAVIGHEAEGYSNYVKHLHAYDFDSSEKDKYNIVQFNTGDNTREGVSLRYAGEYLLKRRTESNRILIAISDGMPMHTNANGKEYYGEIAQEDTKNAQKELSKKGIRVFGINIGGQAVELKKFYNLCIDVPNISELPNQLINILKKNFLK